jgi:hypothetical protein
MAQLTAVIIIDLFSEGGVERDSGVGCDHEGGIRRRSTAGKRLDLKSRLIPQNALRTNFTYGVLP